MQVNKKVRSGNTTEVLLDDKVVGLIQNVRMSDDYGPDAASGVGDIHVVEHVPTRAGHSLTVSTMILKTKSLREVGVAMENGDDALKGLVFNFRVTDKETGELLRMYIGCSYASGDSEISKHAILMSSAQFLALDVQGKKI